MQITQAQIDRERNRLLPPGSVGDRAECLEAIGRLGFVWVFTPGTGLLPALFPALATNSDGTRWDWMWNWKDEFAASRQAYYGKVVAVKPTFVSREWLPVFYALTGNTGDPDDDLVHVSESVRLNEMALKAFGYIREYGPTGTRTLQSKLTDGTRPMKNALDKGLDQLDAFMLIVKCGTEGGHAIANVWDLFPRFHPEAVDAGTEIPTREAAVRLVRQFFTLTPALSERQFARIFPWNEAHQQKAIARLVAAGELEPCQVGGKPGLKRAGFLPPETP
ncbi:MAG TPA: crosslink repair DNA glycosylase YcaQ family protein [Symbiobacteriaceae bacterium]|jgi:hypothetical protein